jgi:uncharacterized protein YndB with AHSA1/START domain
VTEPNIPHRIEVELEIRGAVDDVWHAIATASGISSWMMPTELDDPTGGRIVFHMGPEHESRGAVTAYERHRRFAYEEDWAALAGHGDAPVTPLVTEFLVEAQSGGTCSVRVVSSAFGTGADWEDEFFAEMSEGWIPMLDNLRLYVETFPGQTASTVWLEATSTLPPTRLIDAVKARLGVTDVGDTTSELGMQGRVERAIPRHVLLTLSAPVAGFVSFMAMGGDEGSGMVLLGYLFGERAGDHIAASRDAWKEWMDDVAAASRPASGAAGARPSES